MNGHKHDLDRFTPALQRVLDKFPAPAAAEVIGDVLDGKAQLFEAGSSDNVIVTRLLEEPAGVVCLVWLAAGELEPLLERYKDIEYWARRMGAVRMRIIGRKGWLKVLAGFEQTAVVMEKPL